jgi:topoisomerase IV subunit B
MATATSTYTEANIRSLDWKAHIRLRPGMYIGRLGDGTSPDDGIYLLLKEVIDNAIDEFIMGYGKRVDITMEDGVMSIRDYGRGIPLGKVLDCAAKDNTGAKYDSESFKKSVGLNGVGLKAVNALSEVCKVEAFREGQAKAVDFCRGEVVKDHPLGTTKEKNGTLVAFKPDAQIFPNYKFVIEYVEEMLWNYAFLNLGITLVLNGKEFKSENGLRDLLTRNLSGESLYPIIHLRGPDIEVAFTHCDNGEVHFSYANGQFTAQGGTHLAAFREALVRTAREFYKKEYDALDIRGGIIAAISLRIQEPIFESQTKTKLGSTSMAPTPGAPTVRQFIHDFLKKDLDDFLHKNPLIAESFLKKILQSERERKELSGIKELARERARKANLHNSKLRDCRIHYTDIKNERRFETTLFITEGDSASGSITKSRDPNVQAVFSLKGKPLNTFGLTKRVVYENEEFNMLQSALDIEENLDGLRYHHIVLATDADVDGYHIRLLLITFYLTFFPDLVKRGHLYILQTPLFRVRNRKETIYCYSEQEKASALVKLAPNPEITRFKGLGEISPDEFGQFIGDRIRLTPVRVERDASFQETLAFYMGKNSPERQQFIVDNLRLVE